MPESGGTGPREAEILLYQAEDGRPRIEVRFEGDTAWMTQAGLAELYQTSTQNITQLIAAIYAESELEEAATCKSNLQVRPEGSRQVRRTLKYYSLPVVLDRGRLRVQTCVLPSTPRRHRPRLRLGRSRALPLTVTQPQTPPCPDAAAGSGRSRRSPVHVH